MVVLVTVFVATGLRYGLHDYFEWHSPFLLFIPAIAISALYGGFKPAFLATVLSSLAGAWLFIEPRYSFNFMASISSQAQMISFLVIGLAICALGGLLKSWQQELLQSEERYRLLVQGAQGTAVFFVNPDGRIASWNLGAERIKGYTEAEILGQPISRFFTEEDLVVGLPQKLLEQARQQGYVQAEGWRVRRDGTRFWAEVALTALYDEAGRLRGFSKMTRDSTEKRELAASIEESEHTSRALLDAATQAIIGVGADNRIRMVNKASEAIFGYTRDELVGQPITLLLPQENLDQPVLPDNAAGSAPNLEAMAQGRSMVGRRKDGSTFPVEASFSRAETRTGPMQVSFISDITNRKKIEEDLLRERSQLISILDNSPVLVSIKDLEGNVIIASRSLLAMLNKRPDEFIGRNIFEIFPEEEAQRIWQGDQKALRASKPLHDVEQVRVKDGEWHTYMTVKFPVSYLHNAQPFGICAFSLDISEQKKAEEKMLHAAQHDPLTGLPNRALVYEFGAFLIATARRARSRLAVLFFDLDRFKPINDTYGHETGDKMLQEVAQRLRKSVRASDLVGRLAGDEFVAILTDISTDQDLANSASHILETLRQPYIVGDLELRTSPSIGISCYPNDGEDIGTLIRHADAAMYHAKESGRNTYQFFTPAIHANTERVFAIEQKMRQGIEQSEFELHYQPIVDTHTRQIVGVEALIRWPQKQPDGETMMPGEFIQAAEASGIINQLGNWVIQEACRQHQKWQEQGLPPMRIAVNVSPVQFRARNFFESVAAAVADSGINPACLELEVTESTVMKQVEEAGKTLAGLKDLGLQISLDDFGTGYSSLSQVANLPIDKLKVDQSFIRNIDTNSRSLAIAETVIALGKRLGVKVVAEGIETEEAFELLRECNCDLGQGYLLSAPLPPEEFVKWYQENSPAQVVYH